MLRKRFVSILRRLCLGKTPSVKYLYLYQNKFVQLVDSFLTRVTKVVTVSVTTNRYLWSDWTWNRPPWQTRILTFFNISKIFHSRFTAFKTSIRCKLCWNLLWYDWKIINCILQYCDWIHYLFLLSSWID